MYYINPSLLNAIPFSPASMSVTLSLSEFSDFASRSFRYSNSYRLKAFFLRVSPLYNITYSSISLVSSTGYSSNLLSLTNYQVQPNVLVSSGDYYCLVYDFDAESFQLKFDSSIFTNLPRPVIEILDFKMFIQSPRLANQGIKLLGNASDKVKGVIYDGMGSDFDASLSPIGANFIFNLISNASSNQTSKTVKVSLFTLLDIYVRENTNILPPIEVWSRNGSTVTLVSKKNMCLLLKTTNTGTVKGYYILSRNLVANTKLFRYGEEYDFESYNYFTNTGSYRFITASGESSTSYVYETVIPSTMQRVSKSLTFNFAVNTLNCAYVANPPSGSSGDVLQFYNLSLRKKSLFPILESKNYTLKYGDYTMLRSISNKINNVYYYIPLDLAKRDFYYFYSSFSTPKSGAYILYGGDYCNIILQNDSLDVVSYSGSVDTPIIGGDGYKELEVSFPEGKVVYNRTEYVGTPMQPRGDGNLINLAVAGDIEFFYLKINEHYYFPASNGQSQGLLSTNGNFYPLVSY